jgi:hypothetical protein
MTTEKTEVPRGPSGSVRALFATGALLLLAIGCTDADLEKRPPPEPPAPDNKLAVHGEVCTETPEDLVFPLRVVFLVDASESMEVNDPPDPLTGETSRERAVRETVERLLDGSGDVEVSVVRFSSQAQPLTAQMTTQGTFESYFSGDLDFVRAKLGALSETDRTTNYVRALAEAYAEIRHELMNATQESLALSTYHVIMITDGLPDVEGDENRENTDANILDSIEGIMDLGRLFHVSNMSVSTAFISSGSAQVNAGAADLLSRMAEHGAGTFRSFESGGEINFLHIDLSSLKRVFTLKTLVAQNINAVVRGDELMPDSDGDGLADPLERMIGTDLFLPDSDGDGCRDGMEYRYRSSGMDPTDPSDCQCVVADYCFDENENGLCDCGEEPEGSCCVDDDGDGLCDCIDEDGDGLCDPSNYLDQDGDGLNDCEERYTGTSWTSADSDGDSLPDFLEVRFGTSPDVMDSTEDSDWDGVTNGEEVRTATDPNHASRIGRSRLAYRYRLEEGQVSQGSTCYDFEVSNISLTEVADHPLDQRTAGPAGQGYTGYNRVLVFVGEVPFDDPESYARFRVGCVEGGYRSDGNYKTPPSGSVRLRDEDFVALRAFDPDLDCIPPGGRP